MYSVYTHVYSKIKVDVSEFSIQKIDLTLFPTISSNKGLRIGLG